MGAKSRDAGTSEDGRGIEVTVEALAAHLEQGAVVIDVREPWEFELGHVPGAHPLPLGDLPSGALPSTGAGEELLVICAHGQRSLAAARWMLDQGLPARSVTGGTIAWIEAGYPVVRGSAPGR